eukprot:UN00796
MAQEAKQDQGKNELAFLGDKFVKQDGSSAGADCLKGMDMIAIYFSAHWCPPCRNFTPVLTQHYKTWKDAGVKIEVIFVSSDRDKKSKTDYHKSQGDWLSIEFGSDKKQELSQKYGVQGIPTLIVIGSDGKTIDAVARGTVSQKGKDAYKEWAK